MVALTALALTLRLGTSTRLLPLCPEPDASMVWTYRDLCGETTELLPYEYDGVYPLLLPRLLAALPGGSHLPDPARATDLDEHLEIASSAVHRLRLLAALLAGLLPATVFFVARRFLSDGWALVASAFLAVCLMHQANSAIAKAHAPGVTLAWLTVWCALRLHEAPSWGRRLAAAAAGAAAIGMTQTGLFVLPATLVGLLARGVRGRRDLCVPFLALCGAAPFLPGGIHLGSEGVKLGHGHTVRFEALGNGMVRWPRFLWEYDPVLAALAAVGLAMALASARAVWRRPELRIRVVTLATYVVPYALLLCLYATLKPRYVLPLHPAAALLAAHALRVSARRHGSRWAACALVGLALALPTWTALRFLWLARRPDTFMQLGAWIEAQPGATEARILLSPSTAPPLYPTDASLAHQLQTNTGRSQPWFYHLSKLAAVPMDAAQYALDPVDPGVFRPSNSAHAIAAAFDRAGADWIVLEDSPRTRALPSWRLLRGVVRRNSPRIAFFSGELDHTGGGATIDYQSVPDLARRVLTATAFGPDIEVYAWRRGRRGLR